MTIVVGCLLTVAAEVIKESGLIGELTASSTRLIIWCAVGCTVVFFGRAESVSAWSGTAVAIVLVLGLASSTLSVTRDIAAIDQMPVFGRSGRFDNVVRETLFVGLFLSVAHLFYCVLRTLRQRTHELDSTVSRLENEMQRREQMERQLSHLRDDMAHVARLSTMGEMATGLAHEINQPLAAISTFAFVAEQKVAAIDSAHTAEICEILSRIEQQSHRAGEVIRRLRAMVRKTDSNRSNVDVNELIREVVALLETDMCFQKVDLRLDLCDSVDFVHADPVQIQQVLLNVVRNAADSVLERPGQTMRVTIQTSTTDNGCVAINVTDTGKGLADEEPGTYFNPFVTTKADGLGMGLAISRTIVESHGGKIELKNNPDQGATCHLSLRKSQPKYAFE